MDKTRPQTENMVQVPHQHHHKKLSHPSSQDLPSRAGHTYLCMGDWHVIYKKIIGQKKRVETFDYELEFG